MVGFDRHRSGGWRRRRIAVRGAMIFAAAALFFLLTGCGGGGGGGSTTTTGGGGSSKTFSLPAPTAGNCNVGSVKSWSFPDLNPLFGEQWYIKNTGQSAFSSCIGTADEDIALTSTTTDFWDGSGVKVAVVDTGLELAHEDLLTSTNRLLSLNQSYDFNGADTDPTNSVTTGDHGTSVAGLIAMQADNNVGGRGVAPGVALVGYNFLSSSQTITQFIQSLGGASGGPDPFKSSDVFVFNQSYGISSTDDFLANSVVEAQLIDGITNLRGGKGALYVKSSGNGFNGYSGWNCTVGITCENANFDPYNAMPWNIVVGATNAAGLRSSYSTAGSALWVAAPGGEFGRSSTFKWVLNLFEYSWDTEVLPNKAFQPAMVTTDQSGCIIGYSQTFESPLPYNDFEDGLAGANPDCNYTSTFNGTSSAAPVTTGVIALMLEANAALTWRDVKYILATTATVVDNGAGGAGEISATLGNGAYVAEPGWITNAVGRKFSNWYGFGRVNADAAVTLATGFTSPLGAWKDTGWTSSGSLSLSIPDYSVTGATNVINLSSTGIGFIEAVQVKVSITHPFTGDLSIELQSPGGTWSTLFTLYSGFYSGDNLSAMVLLTNAFYGEPANGVWTIKVVDGGKKDTGTLTNWKIRVWGN